MLVGYPTSVAFQAWFCRECGVWSSCCAWVQQKLMDWPSSARAALPNHYVEVLVPILVLSLGWMLFRWNRLCPFFLDSGCEFCKTRCTRCTFHTFQSSCALFFWHHFGSSSAFLSHFSPSCAPFYFLYSMCHRMGPKSKLKRKYEPRFQWNLMRIWYTVFQVKYRNQPQRDRNSLWVAVWSPKRISYTTRWLAASPLLIQCVPSGWMGSRLLRLNPESRDRQLSPVLYNDHDQFLNIFSGFKLIPSTCSGVDPGRCYEYFMYSFFWSVGDRSFGDAKESQFVHPVVVSIVAVLIRFSKSFLLFI
jgi:hypothetical protein